MNSLLTKSCSFRAALASKGARLFSVPKKSPCFLGAISTQQRYNVGAVNRHINTSSCVRSLDTREYILVSDKYGLEEPELDISQKIGTGEKHDFVDTNELTSFIIDRCSSEADIRFLLRNLEAMRTNHSTRMLTLARMSLKIPSSLRWFLSWLWPIMNGVKTVHDAFPFAMYDDILGNEEEMEFLQERLNDTLASVSKTVFSDINCDSDLSPASVEIESIVQEVLKTCPMGVLEMVCVHLEGFQRGEIDTTQMNRLIKRETAIHSERMTNLYPLLGFTHDRYLRGFIAKGTKKKMSLHENLQNELDLLIVQVVLENDPEHKSKSSSVINGTNGTNSDDQGHGQNVSPYGQSQENQKLNIYDTSKKEEKKVDSRKFGAKHSHAGT